MGSEVLQSVGTRYNLLFLLGFFRSCTASVDPYGNFNALESIG